RQVRRPRRGGDHAGQPGQEARRGPSGDQDGHGGRAQGPGGPGGQPGAAVRRWIEINGTRHQISRPTLVLGRSTDADVRIDDPGVSRRHCEIRTGTPSTIQDLGSTNGIVVDGQHTTRATLRDGSRIVVGSTTIVYRQAEG
ncbi:FHA domain-containing protein, partial [Streptomyces zhihengii]